MAKITISGDLKEEKFKKKRIDDKSKEKSK